MSLIIYNVLLHLVSDITILAQSIFLGRFLEVFGKPRSYERRFGSYYMVGIWFVIRVVVSEVWVNDYDLLDTILRQLLFLILLAVLSALFYKMSKEKVLFVSVMFTAIAEICTILTVQIMQIISNIFLLYVWGLEKGYLAADEGYIWLMRITQLVIIVIVSVIQIFLLRYSLKKVAGYLDTDDFSLDKSSLAFLLAPAVASLLTGFMLRTIMYTMDGQIPRSIYEQYPAMYGFIPAIFVALLVSVIVSVKLYRRLLDNQHVERTQVVLEQQVTALTERIRETDRLNDNIRRMRHDMKNTLIAIQGLTPESDENKELIHFIGEIQDEYESTDGIIHTGHPIADSMITSKLHTAVGKMEDATFRADECIIPKNLSVKDYDLAVILGNAIDNAIEAIFQTDEHWIEIKTWRRRGMLFLEIKNPYSGTLSISRGERLKSTKEDASHHGIGMESIREAVTRNLGGMEWNAKDDVFTLTVMLPVNE